MTVYLKDPDNISNHFDKIFQGIGRRGSSFGNIDGLVHDAFTQRFLFLEFKYENEIMKGGQKWALSELAKQPRTSVWLIRKFPEYYILTIFPYQSPSKVSVEELQLLFSRWWNNE